MKKLLIGLGNPGNEYENSRHNAGRMLIDVLTSEFSIPNFQFTKTESYMNESGKDVRRLRDFFKVTNEDLYVAYDDLDIPLGSFKISKGKLPRVHNGINSVVEELGSEDFWHVRIGVDNRIPGNQGNRVSGKEYVLQDFGLEERVTLVKVFGEIAEDLSGRL